MVNSAVEICNLALDLIGTKGIVNIEDTADKTAKLCLRWYDVSRRSLLKDINASFAIKRAALAEVADYESVYGYENAFALPADCLKVLNIEDPMLIERYQIEGNNYLFCNYKGLVHIRYTFDCTDVSTYDDEFIELFALKLASNICVPLTQDREKQTYFLSLLKSKYVETSTKYGDDNKVILVSQPRFRDAKNGEYGEYIR